MKKKICILGILSVVVIAFQGCYKKPQGSFTLKGRLLYQSDSKPVSGHQVTVTYQLYKGGLSGESKIVEVGNGKSDINGSFEILCDFYNQGSFYYFKEKDISIYNKSILPKNEGEIVNLDTLYVTP